MALAHRVVDSPIGALLLAANERGIVRVAFENEGHAVALAEVMARPEERRGVNPDLDPHSAEAMEAHLSQAEAELREYFDGERRSFTVPLDESLSTGALLDGQRALEQIPYGERWSYGQLADVAGHARAIRVMGTACARNPLPILRPCHRVVRADGSIGQYRGGSEAKLWLLDHEAQYRASFLR